MDFVITIKIMVCTAGVWVGVSFLRSFIGGWMKLASCYRASNGVPVRESEVRRWRFQTAYMRWLTTYGNCVKVRADSEHLFISVILPERIGHPSLVIPWNEVTAVRGKGVLRHIVELRFQRAPSVPLRIGRILYEGLEQNFSSR